MTCQAETEQDHSGKAREQADVWEEVVAEAEWAEIVQEQAPVEVVSAQVVVQKQLIRQEFHAIL